MTPGTRQTGFAAIAVPKLIKDLLVIVLGVRLLKLMHAEMMGSEGRIVHDIA